MSAPFGPGIPVCAGPLVDDTATGPAGPDAASAVATASNRSGTVSVTATDAGLPLDVRVDQRELRYGGGQLAATVLQTCRAAAAAAGSRRRADLAAAGVGDEVLDLLRLPGRDTPAPATGRESAAPGPAAWRRPL